MEDKLSIAKGILKKYNQEHLLQEYNNIDTTKKEYLLNQILNIDFDQINKLYENTKQKLRLEEAKIEPIQYIDKQELTEEQNEKYFEIGVDEIKKGKLAVVTMAGRSRNKTWT